MPAKKSDLYINIRLFEREFSISGVLIQKGIWKIKLGRSWSSKKPYATTTEIFKACLSWVARGYKKQSAGYDRGQACNQ